MPEPDVNLPVLPLVLMFSFFLSFFFFFETRLAPWRQRMIHAPTIAPV